MSVYFLLRYGLIPVAMIGWIIYQLEVKQRKWKEIKGDVLAIAFFIGASGGIFYWLFV